MHKHEPSVESLYTVSDKAFKPVYVFQVANAFTREVFITREIQNVRDSKHLYMIQL